MYAVITALITLLGLGFWLAQPGVSQEQLERGGYVEVLGASGNRHTPRDGHGEIADGRLRGGARPPRGVRCRRELELHPDPDRGIPEDELRAIVAYLRALPPVRNVVPPPTRPSG